MAAGGTWSGHPAGPLSPRSGGGDITQQFLSRHRGGNAEECKKIWNEFEKEGKVIQMGVVDTENECSSHMECVYWKKNPTAKCLTQGKVDKCMCDNNHDGNMEPKCRATDFAMPNPFGQSEIVAEHTRSKNMPARTNPFFKSYITLTDKALAGKTLEE